MNELIQKLKDLFNNQDLQYKLLKDRSINVRNEVLDIITDIEKMQAGEDSGLPASAVDALLSSLKQKLLMDPNTKESFDLVADIVLLVYNWNQNTHKSPAVDAELNAITVLVDGNITMRDTVDLLQLLGAHLGHLQNWTPPAFQISAHLFDRLQGDSQQGD